MFSWGQAANNNNDNKNENENDDIRETSRILLVGSGGIGCELLKNLALDGFVNVTVADLDTIDVSNLNRQLLFRLQDVGKPKCVAATRMASEILFNNNNHHHAPNYPALHIDICDSTVFHKPLMEKFDLVLNALDNIPARRRVNRLCLAARVPLIEAGTAGYLGQTNVISHPEVACYECATIETPKVYPICTIRSTPTRHVHTIVWAKEFYKLIFADKMEESMLVDTLPPDDEHESSSPTSSSLPGETSTYMESVLKVRNYLSDTKQEQQQPPDQQEFHAMVHTLLINLYRDEIIKQLNLGRYKTSKTPPQPMDITMIPNHVDNHGGVDTTTTTTTKTWVTKCWKELQQVLELATRQTFPPTFDKDFDPAMRFVTAAANLRNWVFHIQPPELSLYVAKGIAGNIIPAIATTNAIAAGLQMLQVYRVLSLIHEKKKKKVNNNNNDNKSTSPPLSIAQDCCYNNILRNPTRNGLVITAVPLNPPNPSCFVCRQGMMELICDPRLWTLGHFIQRILKQELGLQQPTIQLNTHDMIWEEGPDSDQDMFQKNYTKTLNHLPAGGIQHGTLVRVDDFTQSLEFTIAVSQPQAWDPDDPITTTKEEYPFLLQGHRRKPLEEPTSTTAPSVVAHQDKTVPGDNDVVMVVRKRKEDVVDTTESAQPTKRSKTILPPQDIIAIEDDD